MGVVLGGSMVVAQAGNMVVRKGSKECTLLALSVVQHTHRICVSLCVNVYTNELYTYTYINTYTHMCM